MKNRKKNAIRLALVGAGVLFAANAIVAGRHAFGWGIAAVAGSILVGALLVGCGVAMLLRHDTVQ
jgi:hypothetical protein